MKYADMTPDQWLLASKKAGYRAIKRYLEGGRKKQPQNPNKPNSPEALAWHEGATAANTEMNGQLSIDLPVEAPVQVAETTDPVQA